MDATLSNRVESFAECLCSHFLSSNAIRPLLYLLRMSPPVPTDELQAVRDTEVRRLTRTLENIWNSGEKLMGCSNETSSLNTTVPLVLKSEPDETTSYSCLVATGTTTSLLSLLDLCAIDYTKLHRWINLKATCSLAPPSL